MKIVSIGDPVLITKTSEVERDKVNEIIKLCIDEMIPLMKENHGAGLAAPQVGISSSFFVSSNDSDPIFINPEIVKYSKEKMLRLEGCLSIPSTLDSKDRKGEKVAVERSIGVKVKYVNSKGVVDTKYFTGLLANVIQHEYDHLQGILITDKL